MMSSEDQLKVCGLSFLDFSPLQANMTRLSPQLLTSSIALLSCSASGFPMSKAITTSDRQMIKNSAKAIYYDPEVGPTTDLDLNYGLISRPDPGAQVLARLHLLSARHRLLEAELVRRHGTLARHIEEKGQRQAGKLVIIQ
ncbi:unnamed protein product [Protopolystoma xenopodis]|uniref:Uncharacterized protein n=1 Tax=Protopolystoma xenopodis TaxID=117903 RepID=A0A448WEA1_9PLAT|nr:unnamed protein product [Protopolystoma xenopodis]